MNPLVTYREKRFEGHRQYRLFADHLVISGAETFRSEFEVKVPLAHLHPEYSRARVRNGLFGFGLLLIVLGGIGVLQRLSALHGLRYEDFWSVLWVALLVAGILIAAVTARKTAHLIFVNENGQSVVGLVERDDAQFKSFVQTLSDQIAATKREPR